MLSGWNWRGSRSVSGTGCCLVPLGPPLIQHTSLPRYPPANRISALRGARVEHSCAAGRQSASGHTIRVSARASHCHRIRRMADHGTNEPLFEVGSRVTVHGHDGTVFGATVVGYPAVGFDASVFVDDGASMVRTASPYPARSVPSPAPTVSRCWCRCVMSLLSPPQHLLSMSPPQQAAPEA